MVEKKEKPQRGEIWKAINTGELVEVTARIFFNIQYKYIDNVVIGWPNRVEYMHYKKFAKYFVKAEGD